MKLTIVSFILVFGCCFTLWMIYEAISYKYGKRIKKYMLNKLEMYEADKWYENNRREVMLKKYKREYTPEIEEAVYEWDIVKEGKRYAPEVISLELTIKDD